MSLGQINHIDIVADASAVRCVVVIAKHLQLLTNTDGGLGNKGNQVHGNTIGQFANQGRRMRTDGIEIPQDDRLDVSPAVDIVLDDFLVDLFRVSVR